MKKEKTIEELKSFGYVMATAFTLLAAFAMWKERPSALYFIAISALFQLAALFAPRLLTPLEKVWMLFGEKMSIVMTFVILALLYYLVFTPMALLLRVLGKDLLRIKRSTEAKSYWLKVDPQGPGSRYFVPY